MRKFLISLLLLLPLAGCGLRVADQNRPAPLPVRAALVQRNWGGGSCCYATLCTLLRLQGQDRLAAHLRTAHGGGTCDLWLAPLLDRHGIRYAMTSGQQDAEFLQAACLTRRGCGVQLVDFYGPKGSKPYYHMLLLVAFDSREAVLRDCNYPECVTRVPARTFLDWWARSDSWALTPIYTPAPPRF